MSADADDTSRSLDQPIKRAHVVYGKRSNHLLPAVMLPVDAHQQSSERGRVRHPPTVSLQRRRSSPSPSPCVHPSDGKRSCSPVAAERFQFSFRHQLRQLDQEFDDRDAQSPRLGRSPSREVVCVGPSQVNGPQSVSMGTLILSSEARQPSGDPSPTSSPPSSAPLRATFTQEYPPDSSLRTPRVPNPVPPDSEVGESSGSSFISPVRHVITTPHSHSSPTPPTSGDLSMVNRKGKGPTRDVLPLLFDDERPLAAQLPIKSKKRRRNEPLVRPKVKPPTKKERRETIFESSRIAVSRTVEVIRTQESKRSLSALFAGLRRDNTVTPTSGAELPSDPIDKFSSPTDNTLRVPPQNSLFGAPKGLFSTSGNLGTAGQPFVEILPPAAGDSDDEMPSVTSIIQRGTGKQQRLQAMKQVALQQVNTCKTSDEDDDLLVVKDDMHTVSREEAVRRRLDKVHGSPVKDIATLRRINHPSIHPAVISPRKLSKQEWQELAKPSFARKGKGSKGQLTKKQLDQFMMAQHTEEQLKSIKRHEEEWIKGGGNLSRDTSGDGPQTSLSQKLGAYAELGLKAVETGDTVVDEESANDSDEGYAPSLRGSVKSEVMDEDEDDGRRSDKAETSQIPQPQVDDDDDDNVAPLRRNISGQRHFRVVVVSDDEGERPVHHNVPSVQRDAASSMESQTEDENDKENSAKLMYDRSSDKENRIVVRHERSFSEIAFGSSPGPSYGVKDGVRESASTTGFNDSTSLLKGDVRSPLKDISKDEDDPFLSSPPRNHLLAEGPLRSAVISPPRPSTSTLSLGSPPVLRSERSNRMNRLSLDWENDENDPSGFKLPQPSFLERLHSRVSPEPSLSSIKPLANGGLSQLFSAEDQSSAKPIDEAENEGLSLTLDVGLKPALEVNSTLRQRAETIFEKEQEYIVVAAVQRNDRPKDFLYVNDHGFLTQTCPQDSSPQVYRMKPSQASKFIGTQVHSTQTQPLSSRPPLRTLSFAVSQELSPEVQPLKRLRRRSPSPLEQKVLGQSSKVVPKLNAFSILGKAPKPASGVQKEKPGKSEFVEVEAEESDDDDTFGFAGPKKDDHDNEGEDDNEQDRVVEGLVDDTVMDAETEAVDLVLEKHREYEEEDDQRIQKLHQDATEGKFRIKRRDRGISFEDDSDEDDDNDARHIRQRMYKKRKIEGDGLEVLGQNEETRAFYDTYHQDLIDEDEKFGHSRDDVAMPVDDNDDTPVGKPEGRETVSADEVRQRVREMAQTNLEIEVLDLEDTSWIDQSMVNEADDAVPVKVVEYRRSKSTARHPNVGQVDFDVERPARHAENEQERRQMTTWANKQNYRYRGTGRTGNGTAITGHTKIKAGKGSLRSSQLSSATAPNETRKTKTSSLLSRVSSSRGKIM